MILLACIACIGAEAQKIHNVQGIVNEVLTSQCFEKQLYARGVSQYWVKKLQNADEDLQISFYRQDNKTLGWTYKNDTHIRLNRKFHDKFSACQTGGTVVHELTHTLGFVHFVDTAYSAGYAFEDCCFEEGK